MLTTEENNLSNSISYKDLRIYDILKLIKFRTKYPDPDNEVIPSQKTLKIKEPKPVSVTKIMKICGERKSSITNKKIRNVYKLLLKEIADNSYFIPYGNEQLEGYIFNEKKYKEFIKGFTRYKIDQMLVEMDHLIVVKK